MYYYSSFLADILMLVVCYTTTKKHVSGRGEKREHDVIIVRIPFIRYMISCTTTSYALILLAFGPPPPPPPQK